MPPLILLLVLLASLALPAGASAQWAGYDERPADKQLLAERDLAVAFWNERGITSCPDGITVTVAVIRDTTNPDARADGLGGGCEVLVDAELYDLVREPWDGECCLRAAIEEECTTVVHETYHAFPGGNVGGVDGYGHTDGGVMDGSGFAETPWVCKRWARDIVERRRAKRRAHRARRARAAGSRAR